MRAVVKNPAVKKKSTKKAKPKKAASKAKKRTVKKNPGLSVVEKSFIKSIFRLFSRLYESGHKSVLVYISKSDYEKIKAVINKI